MSDERRQHNERKIEIYPQPMLSIITVVFNSERYIEKTLKSIFSQTFQDIELVIVDGGSKDGTLDIINLYRDKIHCFISEPDKGIYDAMNKGIIASRGKYLLFLNSGDQLDHPGVLEAIFNNLNGEDVIYGETNLIDLDDKVVGTRSQLTTRKLPKNLTWRELQKGMVVCHQSYIVKKSIAPFYNVEYRCSADIDWMIESLKKSKSIKKTEFPISKYLIGGFSGQNMRKCWIERFQIMVCHYGFISTFFSHLVIILRSLLFSLSRGGVRA